jgi:hypothetical protein
MANKAVSTLAISFVARIAKFTKGVKKMRRDLKKIKKQVAGFAKMSIGITVTGAAVAIAALNKVAGSVDNLVKTAEKLGIVPEKLKGLRHAAELSGVPIKTLDMALQRMTRRLSEAAIGTGEAQGALEELGLNAAALAALSPDEQFMAIADAMEAVGSQSDRVRLAFKIFDSEGVALVNTMKGGSEAIKAAQEDMIALGGSISQSGSSKIVEMQNQVTRLKALFTNVAETVTMLVAGPMAALIERFIQAKIEGGGIGAWIDDGIATAILAIRDLLNALEYLKAGWQGFRAIVITVGSVITKAIAGWIMLINQFRAALGMSAVGGGMLAVDRAMQQAHAESVQATGTALERASSGAAGKEFMDAIFKLAESTDANTKATEQNARMFEEMLRGGLVSQQSDRDYVRGVIIPELVAAGR